MATQGIKITNFNQVVKHLKSLNLGNKRNLKLTRRVLRIPFNAMKKDSRRNLDSQKSNRTMNLYRGLSVGTSFKKSKGYFSVAFGARNQQTEKGKTAKGKTNHFHLVNSGTVKRSHRNGKNVGAVGKGTSGRKNMNPSFRVGFADRAIKPWLGGRIEAVYVKEFNKILNTIKTKGV